jgi:hypothetical protein
LQRESYADSLKKLGALLDSTRIGT